MNEKRHIDDYIFSKLDNAELSSGRIGWNQFAGRRRKKRRAVILFWSIIGLVILLFSIITASEIKRHNNSFKTNTDDAVSNVSIEPGIDDQPNIDLPDQTVAEKYEMPGRRSGNIHQSIKIKEDIYINQDDTEDLLETSFSSPIRMTAPDITSKKFSFKYSYLSPTQLNPQIGDLKKGNKPDEYWFAGFETGLFITDINQQISRSDKAWFNKDYSKIRKEAERNFAGQTLGITFGRQFKQFSVFSGLNYNRISGKGHYDFIIKDAPVINPDNSIAAYIPLNPSDWETINFQSWHTYTSFGIPVGLGMKLQEKGKHSIGIFASFQPTWLLNISGTVPHSVFLSQTNSLSKKGIKLNSSLISLGYNYQYKINSRYLFELNPYFKRNKIKGTQEHPAGSVFHWYGFNGKLIYRF